MKNDIIDRSQRVIARARCSDEVAEWFAHADLNKYRKEDIGMLYMQVTEIYNGEGDVGPYVAQCYRNITMSRQHEYHMEALPKRLREASSETENYVYRDISPITINRLRNAILEQEPTADIQYSSEGDKA